MIRLQELNIRFENASRPILRWDSSIDSSRKDDDATERTALSEDDASLDSSLEAVQPSASALDSSAGSSVRRQVSRKRVRFSQNVTRRAIPTIDDYSREEIEQTWVLPQESYIIHYNCLLQVRKLDKGRVFIDDGKYCARGLESLTKLRMISLEQARRESYDAVLDEQDEQVLLGIVDHKAIADLYRDVASSSLIWAQVVALQDQKAAELIYEEDGLYE